MALKVLFVGGFFPGNQMRMIETSSSGSIQNAANVFQRNLISGFAKVFSGDVNVLNLPFVSPYPRGFNRIYFPKTECVDFDGVNVRGLGFINLIFTKHISRFVSLFLSLCNLSSRPDVIFIYSLHLPFVAAVVMAKMARVTNARVCIIVPDLPEYMRASENFFYRTLKKIEIAFIDFLRAKVDCYVLLTKQMSTHLKIDEGSYIVVEGVAGDIACSGNSSITSRAKSVFYSGTLDERYGVRNLVDAFLALKDNEVELWLCGDGDSKEYIIEKSKDNSRVKYLGQLPREEVIKLQRQATLLVNPRGAEGEFTKYSFPSKVIEYMSSGTPVVMFRLPGIPDEYYEVCLTPASSDVVGLTKCLEAALSKADCELDEIGLKAKSFVENHKSSLRQAERIKRFLMEGCFV